MGLLTLILEDNPQVPKQHFHQPTDNRKRQPQLT